MTQPAVSSSNRAVQSVSAGVIVCTFSQCGPSGAMHSETIIDQTRSLTRVYAMAGITRNTKVKGRQESAWRSHGKKRKAERRPGVDL